jgi:hypothetical protein
MKRYLWLALPLTATLVVLGSRPPVAPGCCTAPPSGKPVVNADQTVVIIWDADHRTQHFIRKASFKSEADDFGFIVPTPTAPDLEESGNDAFPYLQKLTEPEIKKMRAPTGGGCGCGEVETKKSSTRGATKSAAPAVNVLSTKDVAGFHAVVLEAASARDLMDWLKMNGYAFSPAVEAWAKPYVDQGWKLTALKVAKDVAGKASKDLTASALRMSFKTDRPLFPYREPESSESAEALHARQRLLRIYFIGDARYRGELTKDVTWTGRAAWANQLRAEDRQQVLTKLGLPENTGPAEWWLTEFEDNWPYRAAPADVYFSRDKDQSTLKRPPIIQYVAAPWPTDGMSYAIAAFVVAPPLWRWVRRRRS